MKESEEFLDILDEQGNPTGEVRSREEAHQQGLWHRTVHVWVVNSKKEILLQLRAPTTHSDPNCWDISAAGHVPAGESSLQGAVRELEEELGITAEEDDFQFLFTHTREIKEGRVVDRSFNDVYVVCKDMCCDSLALQREEVSSVRWIDWKELPFLADNKNTVNHRYEYGRVYDILMGENNPFIQERNND